MPTIIIECADANNQTHPTPTRQWSLNDIVLYNVTAGARVDSEITDEFNMEYPGLTTDILGLTFEGRIFLTRSFVNITDMELMIYSFIFGRWECGLSNVWGRDTAVTVIRRCGNLTYIATLTYIIS